MSKWWADRGIYYSQCYNLWLSDLCVYSAWQRPKQNCTYMKPTYDCLWFSVLKGIRRDRWLCYRKPPPVFRRSGLIDFWESGLGRFQCHTTKLWLRLNVSGSGQGQDKKKKKETSNPPDPIPEISTLRGGKCCDIFFFSTIINWIKIVYAWESVPLWELLSKLEI